METNSWQLIKPLCMLPYVGSRVVRIVPLCFMSKRGTESGFCSFVFVLARAGLWCSFFCMCYFVSLFLVVSTSAINCRERLVSEMTCYVSSGM